MNTIVKKLSFILLFLIIFSIVSISSKALASYKVFTTNNNSGDVSVVSSQSNSTINTISVGQQPRGIVYEPVNNKIYVAQPYEGRVAVTNAVTDAVITNIPIEGQPFDVAVSPDGSRLYVSDFIPNGTVSVVDTSTNTVIHVIRDEFYAPEGLTTSLDGSRLVVASAANGVDNGHLTVIDTSDFSTITTIPMGIQSADVIRSVDGAKYYAVNGGQGSPGEVVVIDASNYSIIDTIPVEADALHLVTNSTGTRLYVLNTHYWDGGNSGTVQSTISVIDTTTNTVLTTIPDIGFVANGLDISRDGSKVYAAISGSGGSGGTTLSVIDTATNTYAGDITVGSTPNSVAVGPDITDPVLTALSPAKVWVGIKNITDAGSRFDLKAEVYKNSTLISTGQLNSFNPGLTGLFASANLATIPFNSFIPVGFPSGSALKLKLSVRNACSGSARILADAKLWYSDSQANSHFDATLGGINKDYYLINSFNLSNNAGTGPRQSIDKAAGLRCSPFKELGTWVITP